MGNLDSSYRMLFECNPIPMWIFDLATLAFLAVNEAALTQYGYTREELMRMTVAEIRPPEELSTIANHLPLIAGGLKQVGTSRHRKKDGSIILVEVAASDLEFNGLPARLCVLHDVTEQRSAVDSLQQSEAKSRSLLDEMRETRERLLMVARATNDAVWDWKLESDEVWWNEGVCNLFGYTREQVVPDSAWWLEHVHPADRDRVKNSIYTAINSTEDVWSCEYRFHRADGTYAFIFDRGYIMRKDGVAVRMLGAMLDLTERKSVETLNSALYRIADKASSAEDIQEFYTAMHSIVAELMYAKNFYIALYDRDADSISFPYLKDEMDDSTDAEAAKRGLTGYLLRTGQPLLVTPSTFNELVERGEVKSLGPPSVDWLGVPLKTGDTTFGVLVVQTYTEGVRYGEREKELLTFVSQHVANALQRKRSEEALRKSEEKFRTLFEESKDAIFISTADGSLIDGNRAGLEMLGYDTRSELHQANLVRDHYVHPEDHERFHQALDAHGYVQEFELPLRKCTGEKIFVRETATAVRDEAGKIIAFRAILRDVTQLKELEAQLRHVQKMEAVGELAGGVAHDFNNTLMAITGYCELLQMKIPSGDCLSRDILEIMKAADRGAALTRQLLAFSRKQVLEPTILNLNQVLENMQSMLVRLIGEDIHLSLRLDRGLGAVKADLGQIEQVVMNLVVNARDAMPNGGSLVLETTNLHLEQRYLEQPPGTYSVLSVTDTGDGMDLKTLGRIFEPFFTTKEKGKGTGLGLATVYGIVKQSGGYIWPESEPGKGTIFRICLPRTVQTATLRKPLETRAINSAKGETILLVDDDDSVRNAISNLLEMNGYKVIQACNGREAVEVSRQCAGVIDLLITDVVMPQMGGRELAEVICRENKNMKVLFMSGYDEKAVTQGIDTGSGVAFLGKPASREHLLHKIRQLM